MTVDQDELKVRVYQISDSGNGAVLAPRDIEEIYDITMYASQVQPDITSK